MAAANSSIEAAAQKFITSYAAAMSLAHASVQPPTPIPAVAQALGRHYLPGFTSFFHGHIYQVTDVASMTSDIQFHLEKFVKNGVGCDIRLKGSRVEVASSGSALCFVTWEIFPAEGWKGEGWQWENCYFYRKKPDGTEGWEGVITDGEVEGLIKNVPGFY